MLDRPGLFRRHATRIAALAVLLAIYGFARLPRLPEAERSALKSKLAFARLTLPEMPPSADVVWKKIRDVNPNLAPLSAWISSVGAGVALADLDGDGLPNDLCHVDTRVDRALVAPVPGTGPRFALFALEPGALPYERRTTAPMGCLPGDFNEDGHTDLLVYYWGRTPIVFLRRSGAGFDGAAPRPDLYRPVEAVPAAAPAATSANGERWFTNALTSADIDGDGHLDVLAGNYFQDGARILDAQATVPDSMQMSMSRASNGGRKHLLLFAGGTGGSEPTVAYRHFPKAFDELTATAWTLAMGAVDLDGDMLPEIYFANDFGRDRVLHNRSTPGKPKFAVVAGSKTFFTPNSKIIGRDSFKGMGIDYADVNGDGVLDIYVSNIAQEWALQESHFVWVSQTGDKAEIRAAMQRGEAPWRDESEGLGLARSAWGWDARFADFDNDTVLEAVQATGFVKGEKNRWPELHELAMGNDNMLHHATSWPRFQLGDDISGHVHNPFFVRAANGRYYDLAADLSIGDPQVTRGIALADVDGDGDLDFAVANQWESSFFYRNDAPAAGASLDLDLRLPVAGGLSRPAIGAEARVTLPDGRRLVAIVDGGSGHSGKRAPRAHLGLGRLAGNTQLPVEILWRDGSGRVRQTTLQLNPGRHTVVLADPLAGKAV